MRPRRDLLPMLSLVLVAALEHRLPILLDVAPWLFTGVGLYGFTLVVRIDQHPGLGKLRQQAGHFVASGNVLVKIAEAGPQVLQMCLVIE